jgi:NedA-like, galactose-binding domain
MFHWMLPFVSDWSLGNDYQRYPIQEQMELMFSLKSGSFPLYVPGYCGGQSASALTLGQIYHPISHIAALMPGYWNGNALEWNTLLRLLSLGFTHLIIFLLLMDLGAGALFAFILSFVTVYNLRMLDLFRYGASLESWTGYLLLCGVIGLFCTRENKRIGALWIPVSIYWLVTSGHPQMMYYGLFGAILFTFLIPYIVKSLIPGRYLNIEETIKFYLFVLFFGLIGILLSSAYTLPFYYDFLLTNAGRVAQEYEWANLFSDTFISTVNNLFYPLRSNVQSAFGGSPLYLVAILVPVLRCFKVKVPNVIWTIWTFILLVFLFMQGERTFIHYIVWKFIPFVSSFRVAGRASMILPILLLLLLTWIVKIEAFKYRILKREISFIPAVLVTFTALFLMVLYGGSVIPFSKPSIYTAVALREISPITEMIIQAVSGSVLIFFMLYFLSKKFKHITGTVLAFLVVLHVGGLLYYGTWIETKKAPPTYLQMLEEKKNGLEFKHLPGAGLTSKTVMKQIKLSNIEPSLGKFYKKFIVVKNNEQAYELIQNGRYPDQIILESNEMMHRIEPVIENGEKDRVELVYSSFNRLVFEVRATQAGFFELAYPFTGHWKAIANGKPVPMYRANGGYHAIYLPRGLNRIEFKYTSVAALWGLLISCFALAVAGATVSLCYTEKRWRVLITSTAVLLGVFFFWIWYKSLYNGDNLRTQYIWVSSSPRSIQNLAYGRKTRVSPIKVLIPPNIDYFTAFNSLSSSGRSVDGKITLNSGFITDLRKEPWWIVDLKTSTQIRSVVIYEGKINTNINKRPLRVSLSDDLKKWNLGVKIDGGLDERPLNFKFDEPRQARYVLIKASGRCRLALDEVEIY